jgi:hypothetical protein
VFSFIIVKKKLRFKRNSSASNKNRSIKKLHTRNDSQVSLKCSPSVSHVPYLSFRLVIKKSRRKETPHPERFSSFTHVFTFRIPCTLPLSGHSDRVVLFTLEFSSSLREIDASLMQQKAGGANDLNSLKGHCSPPSDKGRLLQQTSEE